MSDKELIELPESLYNMFIERHRMQTGRRPSRLGGFLYSDEFVDLSVSHMIGGSFVRAGQFVSLKE